MNKKSSRRPKTRNLLQRIIRAAWRMTQRTWEVVKPRQRRQRHQPMELVLLLIWLLVGLLLSHEVLSGFKFGQQTQFVSAFNVVMQLEETVPDYASVRSRAQSKFGISQASYESWQQTHPQFPRSVTEISQEEAKAIYHDFWQQGQCSRYQPPLNIACLDSMVNFGVEAGSSFFAGLPPDPKAAAMAVANRRREYRQRALNFDPPYRQQPAPDDFSVRQFGASSPDRRSRSLERISLIQGLERDRALLTQVEAYTPPAPVDPVSGLQQWLQDRFAPSPPAPPQLAASQIYAKAEPFTVEVWIVVEDGTSAPATGVVVSDSGLILTNAHVIEGNPNPMVHIRDSQQNERQFPGHVIVEDRSVDLALIQLTGANRLPMATFADSSTSVKVGDIVYALGSPVGSHWKLTQANVIAVQSHCGVPGLECIRMPRGFLHPGNSGGPLLDQRGLVIGINRALQEATGEGVSIPIETVKDFLRRQGNLVH